MPAQSEHIPKVPTRASHTRMPAFAPAGQAVLSASSFDQSVAFRDASTYTGDWKFQAGRMDRARVMADPLGQRADGVLVIDYRPGDAELITKNAHNPRNELRHALAMQDGRSYDIRFSTAFPRGTPGAVFAQIHGPGTKPPLKLLVRRDGTIEAQYRTRPGSDSTQHAVIGNALRPPFSGQWTDWNIAFKPSSTGDAALSIDVGGKRVLSIAGFATESTSANSDPAGVGHYFKMGIYKLSGDREPATVAFDDFRLSSRKS